MANGEAAEAWCDMGSRALWTAGKMDTRSLEISTIFFDFTFSAASREKGSPLSPFSREGLRTYKLNKTTARTEHVVRQAHHDRKCRSS
jgi:hypothetical protein